jgi:hypothetical protein
VLALGCHLRSDLSRSIVAVGFRPAYPPATSLRSEPRDQARGCACR